MNRNEDFIFLIELNEDLYKRYIWIENALKNENGNVYVGMQAFLEHLFKYIIKRENINVYQTTLGDCLKNNKLTNFCSIRIEYNHFELLKMINNYGNNYKHQKVIDFKFDEFIKFMKEVYLISRKVYNYYHKKPINTIKLFDKSYYENLLKAEQIKKEAQDIYQTNMTHLSEVVIEKNQKLLQLEELIKNYKIQEKKLEKNQKNISNEINELNMLNLSLKEKVEKLQEETQLLKKELREYKKENKLLELECRELQKYQLATQHLLNQLIRKEETSILDNSIIEKIKTDYLSN